MEITFDKKDSTEGLLKIKLTEGDYQHQVDEKTRDYARKANLKGFRPGKVPNSVIRRMYGKSILVDEINSILSKRINEYITENKLKIIGEPLPIADQNRSIDWETQKDFEFDYQIGLVNEFTYELSPKVKIKSYPIEVDDKVIQETVEDLKNRFGKVSYPDESSLADNLYCEVHEKEGDFKKESVLITINKVSKSEQKKLVGLKKEDEVEVQINKLFSENNELAKLLDLAEDEAKKLTGLFTLKVSSISNTVPSEINQELFDRVFGKDTVSNEEEFIQKIKETIGGNYQRETDHFLEHFVEDHFLENTKIKLPEDFLKNWLKATSEGQVTDETITKEFNSYLRSLKWDLIKSKIAEDNNLKVEADEVKDRARDMIISQFGGPAIAEQLKDKLDAITDNYLSHENGQNFTKLFHQIRNEKIMKHIKENLTVVEKKVTVDEFKKIVEEHSH